MSDTPSTEASEWWPQGYMDPSFRVQRQIYGPVRGGDYVRGSSRADLVKTALKFPSEIAGVSALRGKGILFARPYDHSTIEIEWGLPNIGWHEVALVRSTFGAPSTVNDGQTIYRRTFDQVYPTGEIPLDPDTRNPLTPQVYDCIDPTRKQSAPGLTPGRWYYYSLFFQIGPIEWVRVQTTSTPLPKNYRHSEHLWDNIPPYYQWTDDNQREGTGYLRQFLTIFGFELDTTREFVEQWQQVYSGDFCPMKLLRYLGENFGIPYEAGLGDIRYRSLLTRIGFLYDIRGTVPALEGVIEAASKYECEVTQSLNVMLLPDDSDFFNGTGNWAGAHPDLDIAAVVGSSITVLEPELVHLGSLGQAAIPGYPSDMVPHQSNEEIGGRGEMRFWTDEDDETVPVMLTCGCGITDIQALRPEPREILPVTSGIAVEPEWMYGFAIWMAMEVPITSQLFLMWFGVEGTPESLIATERGNVNTVPADKEWYQYSLQGTAPAGAVYMVPAILFPTRPTSAKPTWSPIVEFASAQVFTIGNNAAITTLAPDRYLTLGDTEEKIGATTDTYEGYVMGSPQAGRFGV